jgi:glycosyltransferase involved in cell wall biosynthesis
MKILNCIHNLQGGGAERQLQFLANASVSFGIQAAILCVRDEGRETISPSVPIYVAGRAHHYDPRLILDIRRALRTFQPDIVHLWIPEVISIPAMVLSAMYGVPSIFSYRWAMHWHRPLAVIEFALAAIFSSTVISNHSVTRDAWPYRWLFRNKQGIIIPNGAVSVPVTQGTKPNRQRKDLPIVLYAGRLTRMKNWDCLLQAIVLLRCKRPCRLVMCGQGEDRSLIEARAVTLGIRDCVELQGFQSSLSSVMTAADVLVLPSWSEGMSNVLFEAMACQLPCIISDIPSHRELVASWKCARLFDPHSPGDLACAIEELLESDELSERYRQAGLSVLREYSVQTMVSRYAKAYRKTLSLHSAHSMRRAAS